jgi:hypothetical protein
MLGIVLNLRTWTRWTDLGIRCISAAKPVNLIGESHHAYPPKCEAQQFIYDLQGKATRHSVICNCSDVT